MRKFDVTVADAAGAVGEMMINLLEERRFPIGTLHALTTQEQVGGQVRFRNGRLRLQDVAGFDFSLSQLALFHMDQEDSAVSIQRALACGCVVIDASSPSAFRDEEVPCIVPAVNGHVLATYRARGVFASPGPCAVFLARVLKPLQDQAGIERVGVTTLQAVSDSGPGGMEELATQTTALLNFKDIACVTYPKQIAFNVLPVIGQLLPQGHSSEEMQLLQEVRALLDDPALSFQATCVRVPVFYGHALAVHVETQRHLSAADVGTLLQGVPGLIVYGEGADGYPTPVTEAVGSDAVYVGRIREDPSHPHGLNLWIVADNVRAGTALNSIQIAEILVKDYFN